LVEKEAIRNGLITISIPASGYCTAWTYYGSIGVAAESGLNYLPIYLGYINHSYLDDYPKNYPISSK
jgi:Na+/proline symporter